MSDNRLALWSAVMALAVVAPIGLLAFVRGSTWARFSLLIACVVVGSVALMVLAIHEVRRF